MLEDFHLFSLLLPSHFFSMILGVVEWGDSTTSFNQELLVPLLPAPAVAVAEEDPAAADDGVVRPGSLLGGCGEDFGVLTADEAPFSTGEVGFSSLIGAEEDDAAAAAADVEGDAAGVVAVDADALGSFFFFSFFTLGLYSVMTTVMSLTVMLWYVADDRSMFFSRALL